MTDLSAERSLPLAIRERQSLTTPTYADAIVPANGLEVAWAFLTALAKRDFEEMEACFRLDAHFRALVPSGLREGTGPKETVSWLRHWFGKADRFHLQSANVGQVTDRVYVSYRILVREEGQWHIIEQQAYCVAADGQIEAMNLLCSGFRPVAPPSDS